MSVIVLTSNVGMSAVLMFELAFDTGLNYLMGKGSAYQSKLNSSGTSVVTFPKLINNLTNVQSKRGPRRILTYDWRIF